MLLGGLVLQNKVPAIICQSLSSRARDVAKRPGDVCYATTGAAAETIELRAQDVLEKNKRYLSISLIFSKRETGIEH